MVSFAARIGGTLSPYLAKLGSVVPNLHFLIFGLMAFSAGILNAKLPETAGIPLPDTIQDLVKMKRPRKYVVSVHSPGAKSRYTKLSTSEEVEDGDNANF